MEQENVDQVVAPEVSSEETVVAPSENAEAAQEVAEEVAAEETQDAVEEVPAAEAEEVVG